MPTPASLPPLYARWLHDAVGELPAEEPLSTCHDCAMCHKPDGTVPTSAWVFDASVKCCVYLPELANFLVGGVLGDVDGPGRRTVLARVQAGVAVTPLGLGRPPAYDLVYRNSVNAIGRARSLRCPHFVDADGTCGIWRHRDAMCATWFCRHARGAAGAASWAGHRDLLQAIERGLARYCALTLDADPLAMATILHRDPTAPPDGLALEGAVDAVDEAAFGPWRGRAADYFVACAALVAPMSWADVVAVAGPEVGLLARAARRRHDALDAALPERLIVGPFHVVGRREGGVRVVTFSSLDALDLPSAMLYVLPAFDGRPTREVLDALAGQGFEFEPTFLQKLVDWGVLAPA